MAGPIRVPAEDPSTTSRILDGNAPNGEPIVSVVFGMTFAVGQDGKCTGKGYTLVDQAEWEKAKTIGRFTRPSLLVRDADIWPWKNFTDVVVQGTARSDKPRTSMEVELSVVGGKTKLVRSLSVTGDRWVDRGATGLVLSQPESFTEMPLRYDRAYGGTDEAAEAKYADEEILNYFVKQVDREENEEVSAFSYPRNVAGKGYLIDLDGAKGLPWPNLEFPEDRLRLESLARPIDQWGDRPYPACFDWFHHAWFPRSAHLLDMPAIHDDKVPLPERRIGLFEEGWEKKSLTERSVHPFANGAHPYLCRDRLAGDEKVKITHTSADGRDFAAQLPGLAPRVSLRLLGESKVVIPASVDLLFVEPDLAQLTLVWRATYMTKRDHLPLDWVEKSPYEIDW
jgi:hypothetical protein